MNRKKYIFDTLILGFLKVFISCIFAFSVSWCWKTFFNDEVPVPFYRLGHYFMFAIVLLSYVFIAKVYGAFEIGTRAVTDIAFSQVVTLPDKHTAHNTKRIE